MIFTAQNKLDKQRLIVSVKTGKGKSWITHMLVMKRLFAQIAEPEKHRDSKIFLIFNDPQLLIRDRMNFNQAL